MTMLRLSSALLLTFLLAACGGIADTETPPQMMAAAISVGAPVATATSAGAPSAAGGASVATATMPAPDCAAEGCASLRIIDGNAEAWRIDAARRAALEQMTQL